MGRSEGIGNPLLCIFFPQRVETYEGFWGENSNHNPSVYALTRPPSLQGGIRPLYIHVQIEGTVEVKRNQYLLNED